MLQPLMDSRWSITKTRQNYINSVHFVLVCNFLIFSSVCFLWSLLFTFLLFQLWRQNEPNEPKLPEIQTEGPPAHHISSHCLQRCMPPLKTHNHTQKKISSSTTMSSGRHFWFGLVRNGCESVCVIKTFAAIRD